MAGLTAERLLQAYGQGIFPMAASASASQLYWFDPPQRGLLPVGGVHVSRSLRRWLRRCGWHAAINSDFTGVLAGCADRDETWINAPLVALYTQLFQLGHAHSLEIYEGDELIGGTYGLSLGAAFFSESMFSRRPNASKAALVWMSRHLRDMGFELWDTQYHTAHLASMGGYILPRQEYRHRLARAVQKSADFNAAPLPELQLVLQETTQTS